MKERPILFSGEMVRAILDGRKTQTRRVVKEPFTSTIYVDAELNIRIGDRYIKSPYGLQGDRLWVRETWYECINNNDSVKYAADGPPPTTESRKYKKRASIHLQRFDSRINLEITNIRIERVQDITLNNIIAEGVIEPLTPNIKTFKELALWRFKELWDSINAKRGYSWDLNPWVWVISFKKI